MANRPVSKRPAASAQRAAPAPSGAKRPKKKKKKAGFLRWMVRLSGMSGAAGCAAIVTGAAVFFGVVWYYSQGLPTIEALGEYEPPTVTEVYDRNGELLGEIYEKRRYVVPLDEMPDHLKDAFIAAEDANFYTHGGVDYEGILRAIGRNLVKGRKAQGASTITMQVARNFLLSNEKTYERKIREILLSRRIEQAFDKDHILYLYLNQIYLGSGAYGVEAASRVYFGKDAKDITLAEAAIIAGLPQRPSDYSPHRHWDKARVRQGYVLGQMEAKGYITATEKAAAQAELVEIAPRTDDFLTQAPYFTEHVRRYLVDTYGFDKIYNDGLIVHTTADLKLQKVAQDAVRANVTLADNRVGWRGTTETADEVDILGILTAQEEVLRDEMSKSSLRVGPTEGPEGTRGGYGPVPPRSVLQVDRRYAAVVLSVAKNHAIVGIGSHEVVVPLAWSTWMYTPNPKRSWKYRRQNDLTNVLKRGDKVQVDVKELDHTTVDETKKLERAEVTAVARIYQQPELEGAFYSYRLSDGAVLAMVGGVDFEESEFNRVTQARRQVGSTIKPIVYAAAIGTEKFTVGTMVQDAPTVFQTIGDQLWKPGNYGGEYLGNITLRRALQMSRNVCTVRVLDKIGLDPVYELAGPTLRIGYDTPSCTRKHVPADSECPGGELRPSPVDGMAWCEACDPTSCPLVRAKPPELTIDGVKERVGTSFSCLDEAQMIDGEPWCHSCDVNLRVCDWLPIEDWPETDPCLDARRDPDGQQWCRTCDLSMGLGSSSLTMVELSRAYSVFATYGKLVTDHTIDRVVDRDGTVIESWQAPEEGWPEVMDPSVAGIAHWLLREVATGGTAARTNRLGLHVAGKTGTTNDFYDAWFVGYNTEVISSAWVGFDTPRSMGTSFTGGQTAMPVWMEYMKEAAPKADDKRFPAIPEVDMVAIDETTGRVAHGGRVMPMLRGTAPTNEVVEIGQMTTEDLLTSDF